MPAEQHIVGAPDKVNEIYEALRRDNPGWDKSKCARIAWTTYNEMDKEEFERPDYVPQQSMVMEEDEEDEKEFMLTTGAVDEDVLTSTDDGNEGCVDPGKKRRSEGRGQGLARGDGKGPIGRMGDSTRDWVVFDDAVVWHKKTFPWMDREAARNETIAMFDEISEKAWKMTEALRDAPERKIKAKMMEKQLRSNR